MVNGCDRVRLVMVYVAQLTRLLTLSGNTRLTYA